MNPFNCRRAASTAVTILALLLLGACASGAHRGKAKQPTKRPSKALAQPIISQLDYGAKARYAICQPPACPRTTRKTLPSAVKAPPLAVAVRPVASDTVTGSAGTDADDPRGRILFVSNSAHLDLAAKRAIEALLPKARAALSVQVTGYTDDVGNAKSNQKLALLRAGAVRDYMEFLVPGIADKTSLQAKADCCFVANNRTGEGRSANRRADVGFSFADAAVAPAERARGDANRSMNPMTNSK